MKQRDSIKMIFVWLGLSCVAFACTPSKETEAFFNYGTTSDSARYYFFKGWEEIMDNGRWTASEKAFRKALEFDPNWPLGQSLVGRISRDVEERKKILQAIEANKDQIAEDERLLLDVNLLSIQAAINRAQGVQNNPEQRLYRMQLAENNFGQFARKYPDDAYFKAEYIEFLHANHDAQTALDSLKALATTEQLELGFYISYQASLELELNNLGKAQSLLAVLEENLSDPTYTSPLMLQAQIYMAQDSLKQAKLLVDQVVEMDPNHLIAQGTKSRIDQQLGID